MNVCCRSEKQHQVGILVASVSSGIKGKIHKYFKMFALYYLANWPNVISTYRGKLNTEVVEICRQIAQISTSIHVHKRRPQKPGTYSWDWPPVTQS